MRKVYIELKFRVILDVEEGVSVDDIVGELDYSIDYNFDERATVIDTEMVDFEITDSK